MLRLRQRGRVLGGRTLRDNGLRRRVGVPADADRCFPWDRLRGAPPGSRAMLWLRSPGGIRCGFGVGRLCHLGWFWRRSWPCRPSRLLRPLLGVGQRRLLAGLLGAFRQAGHLSRSLLGGLGGLRKRPFRCFGILASLSGLLLRQLQPALRLPRLVPGDTSGLTQLVRFLLETPRLRSCCCQGFLEWFGLHGCSCRVGWRLHQAPVNVPSLSAHSSVTRTSLYYPVLPGRSCFREIARPCTYPKQSVK